VLEGLYFFTGREIWFRISGFWTKIFAVSFGMGVVSGIIMPFQFGTNWSRFSDAAANVLSPMMAYEDLMAFFLEASFLDVLLFGRKLVPAWAHFVAALMVGFGTLLSSFWILMAGSSPRIGWRSSLTRPSPIASPTTSLRSTSPPPSS